MMAASKPTFRTKFIAYFFTYSHVVAVVYAAKQRYLLVGKTDRLTTRFDLQKGGGEWGTLVLCPIQTKELKKAHLSVYHTYIILHKYEEVKEKAKIILSVFVHN